MKLISLLLVVFLAALLEITLVSLPLTIVVLLMISLYRKGDYVFWLAFFLGILLDILQVRFLGTTSSLFLLVLFISSLYERKVTSRNPFFVGGIIFLASFLYSLLTFDNLKLSLSQSLGSAFLALLLLLIFNTLINRTRVSLE